MWKWVEFLKSNENDQSDTLFFSKSVSDQWNSMISHSQGGEMVGLDWIQLDWTVRSLNNRVGAN